jgi:hypothetical protein
MSAFCTRPAVGGIMEIAGYSRRYFGTSGAGCDPRAISARVTLSALRPLMQIKDGSAETVCDI